MIAYFVLGPEASGTKFLTECLLDSTKGFGDFDHDQRLGDNDELLFPTILPQIIVLRRSLPHGAKWPNLPYIVKQLQHFKYEVKPLLIIRDTLITMQSQVKAEHVTDTETALANIRKVLKSVYVELPIFPITVTYEALLDPRGRYKFFTHLGLPSPRVTVIDGNKKYLTPQ